MATMVIKMYYNEIDTGEGQDKANLDYRDVTINAEINASGQVYELHVVYAAFLTALGYSDADIQELLP